jgi:hypothetical protein
VLLPFFFQDAFVTAPDRIQRVQTVILLTLPSTSARTFWRLGRKRRLLLFSAWLILWPTTGPFPHISQTRDIVSPYR